eukprot:TRINITY_DN10288_c0_g1_i1.p3 TRINITY_DN10288_c0_g1~~TRINITY_DN10288_c0_g1_i1.p3  ORF type:complete len:276 (+),score=99.37 TRINITY_DN10288_c0_g1_i1:88-915(+)
MGDDEEETTKTYELYVKDTDKPREGGSQRFSGHAKAYYVNPEGELTDTYDGQFVEGFRRGKGTYIFKKNGDKYEGNFMENKKHGFGKTTYSDKTGDEEEGAEPEEDAPKRGGVYLGTFTAGKRGCREGDEPDEQESAGTFTYVNGDVYTGQWRHGKKHGKGCYTYAKDETQLEGEWENGKIKQGSWRFPNGMVYCGAFRYNKPFGKGVWIFKNGNQLEGEYVQKEQEDPDGGGGDEEEEGKEKPDPKVWVYFKHGKETAVRSGTMFGRKFPAAAA